MNKTLVLKLLALTLSLCMLFTLLTACDNGKDVSSKPSSSDTVSQDDTSSGESEEPSSSDDDDTDDDTDDTGDTDDDTDDGDYTDPDEDIDIDDGTDEEEYIEELKVYNGKAPLITNYRGVSASVYHGSVFMKDKYGRNYTDEMAKIEMDRLQDAGIRFCRTYFRSQWVWDSVKNQYNWKTDRIKDFYRYAKELQKRGVNIILTIGWHFDVPVVDPDKYSTGINDTPYIYGKAPVDNIYGELNDYNYSGMTENEIRLSKIGLRYGEFAKQAIQAMRAENIHNVTHILTFTEPSYRRDPALKEGSFANEYITTVKAIKYAFRKDGTMNNVKMVGPNQGSVPDGEGLLRIICEKEPELFDVLTAHFYPTATNSTDDVYGDLCTTTFGSYMDVVTRNNLNSNKTNNKKEFWVDEFYARSSSVPLGVPSAWNGLQTGVGILTAMNLGIQNISLWQIYDQLWIDQDNTGGEFVNGIHACGSAPSLFVSSIPKPQFYPVSMLGKYLGHEDGKVFGSFSEYASGVYVGAVQHKDGNWTFAVINTNYEELTFRITFDNAISKNLYRHVYNAAGAEDVNPPTTAARLPGVDRKFKDVKKILKDKIPSGSVVVYTSLKF